ncbi:MAG: 2-phospho-L-lactate guanylyltransferase [Thermodesulfobacteriota bacterium]
MLWAVVPAKLGAAVKTRLGAALTPAQRHELAQAMLSDVLDALAAVPALAGTAVVTRDGAVESLAARRGATTLRETAGGGLNAAVAEGIVRCRSRGASGVVVVMGDLPCLDARQVARALELLPARGALAVPSLDGSGTNVLALRPPDVLPETHFGPGSLELHRAAAAARGVDLVTSVLPGAALDVDTVADLELLARNPACGRATRGVLGSFAGTGLAVREV